MNDPRLRLGPWPSHEASVLFETARELHRAGRHDQARKVWYDACERYRAELVAVGVAA